MDFASDNAAGASRPILEALLATNDEFCPAYGADRHTAEAEHALSAVFEREVASFLVATGTGANALALGAITPPWGAVFCHEHAHIIDDECGAPEMFSGGAKFGRHSRRERQDHAGGTQGCAGAFPAWARQASAARRA